MSHFCVIVLAAFLVVAGARAHTLKLSNSTQKMSTALATLTLEETLFVKICDTVKPLIVKDALALTIPGESGSHYEFSSFKLSQFSIGGLAVTFKAPNQIVLSIKGLSMAVPETYFKVWAKIVIVKVSCSGNFWASMSNTDIDIALSLTTNPTTKKLEVTAASSSIRWGSLSINHKFHSVGCKVAQSIVQVFIGSIDKKIRSVVEKELPTIINKESVTMLNKVFAKLPVQIAGLPTINSAGIAVAINLIPNQFLWSAAPPAIGMLSSSKHDAVPLRFASLLPARDIEVDISASSVDEILDYARRKGKMSWKVNLHSNTSSIQGIIPAAYKLCPSCPMYLDIVTTETPQVTFIGSNMTLAVKQGLLSLYAINSRGATVPFASLYLDATVRLSDFSIIGYNHSTIFFHLNVPVFSMVVQHSDIGPIDAYTLTRLADWIINLVTYIFNTEFSGLTIPLIDGFGLVNMETAVESQDLSLAADVVLPPL